MTQPSAPAFRGLGLFALALLATTVGCQRDDPRVRNLTAGISRDSAIVVMGGPSIDQPRAYMISGQMIEAFLYRRNDIGGPLDSLTREQLTPIVVINGELSGWGWPFWDSVATAHGIEVGW